MNDLSLNYLQGWLNTLTTKTIKTILFASLIVAMILPFSGMQFATAQTDKQAENETDERTKAELSKRIKSLESNKQKTVDERHELKQYKLIQKWFAAEGNPEKQHRISEKIKADFPTEYTQAVDTRPNVETGTESTGENSGEITLQSNHTIGPIYYTGTIEKNYNCQTQSDDLGHAGGSLTMYGSGGVPGAGWTYWGTQMYYPSEINKPAFPGCADIDWDHSVYRMTAIPNTWDNCEITTYSSSTDGEGKVCLDIEGGMIVLTEGQSFYSAGNSKPFSPNTSDRYVWLV